VVKIGENTERLQAAILTKKLDVDKIKKIKKKASANTVLPPTRRQKPTHKKPNGGGYAAAQTFHESKKRTVLRLNKRK
jgi:hypothetical protein